MLLALDHYFNHRDQYPDGMPAELAVEPDPPPSFTFDAGDALAVWMLDRIAWRLDVEGRTREAVEAHLLTKRVIAWQSRHPELVKGNS